VREIAVANGMLPGRIEPTEDPTFDENRPLQQVEETDLALLHRLAADYDCKVFVAHAGPVDRLGFVATSSLLSDAPIEHELAFNENVVDLETSFEAFETDPAQRLVSTDPQTGERLEITKTSVSGGDAAWTPDAARIARMGGGAEWVTALLAKGIPVRSKLTDHWRTRERETRPGGSGRPHAAEPRGTSTCSRAKSSG
jgi:hypothetical protein